MFDPSWSLVQGNVLVPILSLFLILWAALVFITRQSRLATTGTPYTLPIYSPQNQKIAKSLTHLRSETTYYPQQPSLKQKQHPTPTPPTHLLTEFPLQQEPPTMTTSITPPTPSSSSPSTVMPMAMPMSWRASFSLASALGPGAQAHRFGLHSDSVAGRKGSGSTCGRWSSDDGGSEGGSRYGSFAAGSGTGEGVFAGIGEQFGGGVGGDGSGGGC